MCIIVYVYYLLFHFEIVTTIKRSAESGEEDDLRYHELQYRWKQYPSYVKNGRYRQYHQLIAVKPQPYYGTCRDAPQCRSCKAPRVPSYQPSARSVRVESRAWEHQFDEDVSQFFVHSLPVFVVDMALVYNVS